MRVLTFAADAGFRILGHGGEFFAGSRWGEFHNLGNWRFILPKTWLQLALKEAEAFSRIKKTT